MTDSSVDGDMLCCRKARVTRYGPTMCDRDENLTSKGCNMKMGLSD